jgi:type IV secretion system protein VirD4
MANIISSYRYHIIGQVLLIIAASYVASLGFGYVVGLPAASILPWTYISALTYGMVDDLLTFAAGIAGVMIFVGVNTLFYYNPNRNDARFARHCDFRKGRMLTGKGLYLGRANGSLLSTDESGHTLVCARTRSGKGVGLVIPNLLSWYPSAIVIDIKGENFQKTSGFRKKMGQTVYRFAPKDETRNTHRLNPLDFIRFDSDHCITDLTNLASKLFPLPKIAETVWRSESQSLFVGIALYLYERGDYPTLGTIYKFLHKHADLPGLLKGIVKTESLSETVTMRFNNYIGKADKEQSGVKTSMNEVLEKWAEPLLDNAMSASDFSFEEFRKKRTTLYICIEFAELVVMAPVLNFIFEMCLAKLASKEFDEKREHELLFMLDEFPSLGAIDIIGKRISDLAGYGIRIMAIVQDLNQLEASYGRHATQTLLSNMHAHVYFGTNDLQTAKQLSERLGMRTIEKRSKSYKRSSEPFNAPTISISSEKVPLMRPEDIIALPNTMAIILKHGTRPVKAKRIVYYKDKVFSNCLLPPVMDKVG